MVDRTDLNAVVRINNELIAIEQATENFQHGGRIVNMAVGGPDAIQVIVPTLYMTYPPQMVAGIIELFKARKLELAQELAELGVTNVEVEGQVISDPVRRRT
jgi:hypothetical protein